MHKNFKAVGISYKNSSVEVREKVSMTEDHSRALLRMAKERLALDDLMVVSTCNRTELYYSSEIDHSRELLSLLSIVKDLGGEKDEVLSHFDALSDGESALKHLFRVAMGLESHVLGDIQISNQIKKSYQYAADEEMAGPFLHRLMHTIFYSNKRVVQETPFRDGAASVSYAAAELVNELISDFINPKIFVLGIGEIGADVVRNLTNEGHEQVIICNRTFSKAQALAEECGYMAVPFEDAWKWIQECEVVISSVAMDKPFVSKERVEELRLPSYKFFIDLSVPRSVAADVDQIPAAIVYNIDDINNRANAAVEKRRKSIPQVEEIVGESMHEFYEWTQQMQVSPTIHKIKNSLEEIRRQEVARHLKNVDPNESELIEKITKGIVQKIVKLPVLQLKAACKRGEADELVGVLNELFDLEQSTVKNNQ